jgi:hypothetical protein
MSTENKTAQSEELTKSIDALLDEVFSEVVEKGSPLDLAQDSKTTADAAIASAPAMQSDASRGAGRPKQISDVPQSDQDGKRDSEYDAAIAQAHGEEENEEAKKQSKAIDQVSAQGHMASKPVAPRSAPFKKSDGTELSDEEVKEFEEFRKSKAEAAQKAAKVEELRKAESAKKEQEDLVKSAVAAATAKFQKENEELRKSFHETQELIKAMASQPVRAKSVTNIESLEKSQDPSTKGPETFTKSEILDAAFDLAKSGKIDSVIVSEIEMTGRCNDAEARAKIEKHLEGKK